MACILRYENIETGLRQEVLKGNVASSLILLINSLLFDTAYDEMVIVLLQLLLAFVCHALYQACACPGGTAKVLNVQSLEKWVRAEFDILRLFLKINLDE